MQNVKLKVDQEESSKRLDNYLAEQFPRYSRTYFKKLIEEKKVKVNNKEIDKPSYLIKSLDTIEFTFPVVQLSAPPLPEHDLGVKVIYNNTDFLIVFKPAGLVVHKTSHKTNEITLVDWLIHHFKEIKNVGNEDRPGIVHRLDKDTSGILIIPKNNYSHKIFSDMFKDRKISKTYLAIVDGHPKPEAQIEYNITRHPVLKHKMTHTSGYGRNAITIYKVIKYLKDASLVEITLITGRTHQIRVHFAAIGHPLIGDVTYGRKSKLIARQALHAYKLSFTYDDKYYSFCYSMPEDMQKLVYELE